MWTNFGKTHTTRENVVVKRITEIGNASEEKCSDNNIKQAISDKLELTGISHHDEGIAVRKIKYGTRLGFLNLMVEMLKNNNDIVPKKGAQSKKFYTQKLEKSQYTE